MYTLYYSPGTASMIVHLALLETGAPHELRLTDIEKKQHKDPAYLKLNPHGVIPTLLVDDKPYTESSALLLMLAERHPEAGLIPPAGSDGYYQCRQWIMYLSHSLQSTFRLWFYPAELGFTAYPDDIRAALQARIAGIWDHLEAHLQAQGPYLLGEQFSAADLYLTMLARWSRNMPRPATEWPALNRLIQLVVNRPSWKTMMEIEKVDVWPRENNP